MSSYNSAVSWIVRIALVALVSAPSAWAQVPPVNDDFDNALVITDGSTWTGTNQNATAEPGEPLHANVPTGASIWFAWTASVDGYLTVDTFGSNYDSVLAMYTGVAVDQLTAIAADDDTGGTQSQLPYVPVSANNTYWIAVDGYQAGTGDVVLTLSFFDGVDVTPPTVLFGTPQESDVYVHNALVPAYYLCEDEALGSGVSSCIGDVAVGEFIATSTFGAQTFSVVTEDAAGNQQTQSITYTVSGTDTTPPVVSITSPANGAVFAVGSAITAAYSCADEFLGTGLATCTGDLPDGDSIDTTAQGTFQFSVMSTDNAGNETVATSSYTIVVGPENDNFADAVELIPATGGTWTGTNVGATVESGEPDHVILPSDATIWFQYTPLIDGYVTIDTFGSSFNTALAMYTGVLGNLTYVAANNDAAGVQSQMANVAVIAGTTYHVAVDGYFGATGLVTLNWSFAEQFDYVPPVVTFWSPSDGLVLPQGEPLWAGYSCYDPVPTSGLLYCDGNAPSGTMLDTSVPGQFVFTVTAEDGEGNMTQLIHEYTVVQNPANDDFVDALELSEQGTISGTNLGATDQLSEPFHAGSLGGASVWFYWTAPGDGFLSADTLGSNFDTLLAIYTGAAVNALTEIDSNDNATGALSEIHDAPVFAGETYFIVVSGAWGEAGDYSLTWSFQDLNDTVAPVVDIVSPENGGMFFEGTTVLASFTCTDEQLGSGVSSCTGTVETGMAIDTSTVGANTFSVTGIDNSGNVTTSSATYTVLPFDNDAFSNAFPISGTGSLVATNAGATKEVGESDHAGNVGGASVWFAWTAATDGFLSVDTLQSDFDTTLAVYTGSSVDSLTELGSDDNSLGQQSRIRDVPVTNGQTYYIAVDGFDGATGQIDLDWIEFNGPTFSEITPVGDPLWVTDLDHDFWLSASAPADIDGDGDLDLAAIGYFVEYQVSAVDRFVVFINEGADASGNWTFSTQEVPLNGLGTSQADLAWGDFDNDGDPDLAVGASGNVGLYRNDGGTLMPLNADLPGYYEDSSYSNAYDLRSITWADYDNDSDLDLLIPSTFDQSTFTYGTSLMRNDGAQGTDSWLFTEVESFLHGNVHAQTAWADNDGDGDLDLFMANIDNLGVNGYVRTYRNDGGVFVSAEPLGNLDIDYGTADWSDYDGDGDLDILVAGLIRDLDGLYKTLLRIYDNVDGVYQPNTIVQSSFFPWLDIHAATWADYDSDGDVDILLTGSVIGEENIEGKSEVYVNEGGQFFPLGRDLPAPIDAGSSGGAFTWFDIDGDGDLDYFVAGAYWVPDGNNLIESQMHMYRNDSVVLNAAPEAPAGLTVDEVVSRTGGNHMVNLSWMPSADDTTPAIALTYDLEVRPSAARANVRQNSTFRRLPEPGNISNLTTWTVRDLQPGTYSWSVRAVDSAFNGSPQSEGSFTVGQSIDSDGDGIFDDQDNCLAAVNSDQRDTDGDGYGNLCDPDLNGDGVVNFIDVSMFADVFLSSDSHADLNGDGSVNFVDFAIVSDYFLQPPGPSAFGM